jgi:4-diphosphocytidyl-2-C-methyl-D-erythritol kinase
VSQARLAPAKVNLFLHVGPLADDGYHPLASWMVFADVGDVVRLEPADAPSFEVVGPFAGEIGPGENLVERAARLFGERAQAGASRLVLDKRLPVAAGLGGGSSDAGAALHLLNGAVTAPLPLEDLTAIAAALGADGPACLHARAVLARGRGDELGPAPSVPPLPAVLLNPRRPCSTGAVYRAYDHGPPAAADMPDLPSGFENPTAAARALASLRNDLEPPAVQLEPAVGETLDWLRAQPETLLARMSGSGATCFALCADWAGAERLAARAALERPAWWSAACRLT